MAILPEELETHSSLEILRTLEQGELGFDHRVIRRLLATPEETAEALETLAEAPADDAVVDLEQQIFDLFRQLRSPQAQAFYISRLRNCEPGEVPDELVEAFAELGEAAIEPLLALHEELLETGDAGDVLFVLSALGIPDERIRALIVECLQQDPYEGALCAGLSRDPALKPSLEQVLAGLGEEQNSERQAIRDAIESIDQGQSTEEIIPPDIYQLYPEEETPLFDMLPESTVESFLESPSEEYRAAAAASLIDRDYEDDTRDALLRLALEDASDLVRGGAWSALGERREEPAVRSAILGALLDPSRTPRERSGAMLGLAGETGNAEIEKAILELYEIPETRALALEAMFRSLDARYAPYFPENLAHEDIAVRQQAIRGLGIFGLEKHHLELVPFFQDEALREDALFSYALCVPGDTSSKSVHQIFEEIEEKADGLSAAEAETVGIALDRRLEREGLPPEFYPEQPEAVRSIKSGTSGPD